MTPLPSQNFVDIKEIRDGVVILKNGGLRAVVMTTGVNLVLKSIDEQEAAIASFQGFLNTLEFPVQIVAQSRKLDIRPYIQTLEDRLSVIQEELLRIQTREYVDFIRSINEQINIMTKRFYVIVPYSQTAITSTKKTFVEKIFSKKPVDTIISSMDQGFEKKRSQLEQRVGVVQAGLGRLGLNVQQLSTEQLIDLYYNYYNPGDIQTKPTVQQEA